MAFIPTPDTVKVCMRFVNHAELSCNVFHIDMNTDPNSADLDTLGDILKGWWNDEMKPLTSTSVSLEAIEITDISVENGDGIVYTAGLPIAGTNASGSLPNNATVATKMGTGLVGRSRRGRSYFVGLPLDALQSTGQQITTDFRDALKAAWEALPGLIISEGWQLVVTSFFHNNAPRVAGLNTPIISFLVDLVVDSQRRRLPGTGS